MLVTFRSLMERTTNHGSMGYGCCSVTEIVENNATKPAEVRQSRKTVYYIQTFALNSLLLR